MPRAVTAKKIEPAAKPVVLGVLIDQLELNRRKRREYEVLLKPLEEEYKTLKASIMEQLESTGQSKAGSDLATVSISEVTVPAIDDIGELLKYLIRTKSLHVFLAQPLSTPSWRELVERKGTDLPGTHTFVKRDLNHSSIKS